MYVLVCVHTVSYLQQEVISMKMGKSIALMAMGAGAVLAYQKYQKPVMRKMEKVADEAMKKANKKLEDMMQSNPPILEDFFCYKIGI